MLFEAEVRRKPTGGEDALTSRVIGALGIVDMRCLGDVLDELTGDEAGAEDAEIRLWPRYGLTEPDVVFVLPERIVVIEAKYGAPLTSEQLVREWRDVRAEHPELPVQIVALTKDPTEPAAVGDARSAVAALGARDGTIRWTRWQHLAKRYERLLDEESISQGARRLLGEVVRLMEASGVRGFRGVTEDEIAWFRRHWAGAADSFAKFRSLSEEIGEFSGGEILPLAESDGFYRDGKSNAYDWIDQWRPTSLEFLYENAAWDEVGRYEDKFRHLYLFLRYQLATGVAFAGVGWLLGGERLGPLLIEKEGALSSQTSKEGLKLGVSTYYREWFVEPEDYEDALGIGGIKVSGYAGWRLELVKEMEWEALRDEAGVHAALAALRAAVAAAEAVGLTPTTVREYLNDREIPTSSSEDGGTEV